MTFRLAVSAAVAVVLVTAAIWLGRGLLPLLPPPEQPEVSLRLVEPLESERRAVAALRSFLAVAPSKRFREAAAEGDLRVLEVGPGDPAEAIAIPGTRVPPVSRERAALMERARGYARAYNLLVERQRIQRSSSAAAAASPERTAPSGVGATR